MREQRQENKKPTPGEIRAELIAQDKLEPNAVPIELWNCKTCDQPFTRIAGRGDNSCGCFRKKAQ